jgi:hypothetical protein
MHYYGVLHAISSIPYYLDSFDVNYYFQIVENFPKKSNKRNL